jgi:hypothetical protein
VKNSKTVENHEEKKVTYLQKMIRTANSKEDNDRIKQKEDNERRIQEEEWQRKKVERQRQEEERQRQEEERLKQEEEKKAKLQAIMDDQKKVEENITKLTITLLNLEEHLKKVELLKETIKELNMKDEMLKILDHLDKINIDITETKNCIDEANKKLIKIKAITIGFETEKLETLISQCRNELDNLSRLY